MQEEYNKKIEAIIYEHETVPGKELTSVQTEYENKRKTYDTRVQEIIEIIANIGHDAIALKKNVGTLRRDVAYSTK